jgi:hypothetical protein
MVSMCLELDDVHRLTVYASGNEGPPNIVPLPNLPESALFGLVTKNNFTGLPLQCVKVLGLGF